MYQVWFLWSHKLKGDFIGIYIDELNKWCLMSVHVLQLSSISVVVQGGDKLNMYVNTVSKKLIFVFWYVSKSQVKRIQPLALPNYNSWLLEQGP